MKKIVIGIYLAFLIVGSVNLWADQTVTDMFGRSVTLPDSKNIDIIFSGNPVASVFLYSLAPDLLGNWNFKMSKPTLTMFPEAYRKLPVQGTLWGSSKPASDEEILKIKPAFILIVGPRKSSVREVCDKTEKKLQIPVVYLDNDLNSVAEAYTLLGSILGRVKRAKILSDYTQKLLVETSSYTKTLKDVEKKRIFYSLSKEGLDTYPTGVTNSALIELCGGKNIISLPYNRNSGPMKISFEEVVLGDPEFIIAGHSSRNKLNDGKLYKNGKWEALDAEVYIVPNAPFNAFDKPPSVNQLAGILWLRKVLYPVEFTYKLEEELQSFYSLFFHM